MAQAGNQYNNNYVSGNARVHFGNKYDSETEEEKILHWLSQLDPTIKHSESFGRYKPGTLDWFFQHSTYQSWLNSEPSVLWCDGIMGAGKTILSSAVVESLNEASAGNPQPRVAFFYCLHDGQQTAHQALCALLAMLLRKRSGQIEILDLLRSRYRQHPLVKPSLDMVSRCLEQECVAAPRVILVLDGVDELAQVARDELIDALRCQFVPYATIFVTSRNTPDAGYWSTSPKSIRVAAEKTTIWNFVRSRMDEPASQRLRRMLSRELGGDSETLEGEILHTVTENAKDMFLLATLLMDLVIASRTISDVKACLKTLPSSLDEYYERTWNRIIAYADGPGRQYAVTSLAWVVYATRPLTWAELQCASTLAVRGNSVQDLQEADSDIISAADLLELCMGLLAAPETGADPEHLKDPPVRYMHFSTQEYFVSNRRKLFPDGERWLTGTCLRYLDLWVDGRLQAGKNAPAGNNANLADEYGFPKQEAARYCINSSLVFPGDTLLRMLHDYAAAENIRGYSMKWFGAPVLREYERGVVTITEGPSSPKPPGGLQYLVPRAILAEYALTNIYHHARRVETLQIAVTDIISRRPQLYGLLAGSKIPGGLRPSEFFDSSLVGTQHCFAFFGRLEAAKRHLAGLLQGTQQWRCADNDLLPLHHILKNGHLNKSRLSLSRQLLQYGASVNLQNEYGQTPLHLVVYPYLKSPGFALFKGFTRKRKDTTEWQMKLLRLVLDSGADPNMKDRHQATPLHDIARTPWNKTWVHTIGILLQCGADPSLRDESGRTPLDWVLYEGGTEYTERAIEVLTGGTGQHPTTKPQAST